ncbi:hypothetical protein U1Q18_048705 [Sarracenia purpurea var. burkii]
MAPDVEKFFAVELIALMTDSESPSKCRLQSSCQIEEARLQSLKIGVPNSIPSPQASHIAFPRIFLLWRFSFTSKMFKHALHANILILFGSLTDHNLFQKAVTFEVSDLFSALFGFYRAA